jgi:Ni/Fe-hydrogenase subunit HybB-like protein
MSSTTTHKLKGMPGMDPEAPVSSAVPAGTFLVFGISAALVAAGGSVFLFHLASGDAARAWQSFLVSFLLFSAIAQGAVLFSTIMHMTGARWSGPLSDLAEAFSAFFPISFMLFLLLPIGSEYLFPWIGEDLHGKEVWLNLPFLFLRDGVGLFILYGLGMAYLYHAWGIKISRRGASGTLGGWLARRWERRPPDLERYRSRMTVLSGLYMLAFAVVLSLVGFDLVMSMDPHWFSTLFGGYTFVKAIYVGFGALIILASVLHLSRRNSFRLASSQFHDIGKLFFAFGLVWADFFYVQLVVIWYGNIPEEAAYVIERVMMPPWNKLAWAVFIICFVAPFLILINKRIKTVPAAMIAICSFVIYGIWLEHFLLLGPAYHPHAPALPLDFRDFAIAFGFLGLMIGALAIYLKQFPEIVHPRLEETR